MGEEARLCKGEGVGFFTLFKYGREFPRLFVRGNIDQHALT
jgi:hypothetical protein